MSLKPWQLELAEAVEQQRRDGLGWRWGDMKSWPTEKIFSQLRELGVDTDASQFHDQAEASRDFNILEQNWLAQMTAAGTNKDFWPDFPLISVPILWTRLAADVICADLIERRLYEVIRAEEENEKLQDVDGMPANVAAVLGLTRFLQGFTPADRVTQFDKINNRGVYDCKNWLEEFIFSQGSDWPDLACQLADLLPHTSDSGQIQLDLALALAQAGRRDEAISRAKAVLSASDTIWNKILAGDVFEELDDATTAIRLWLEALPMAGDRFDYEAVVERLTDALSTARRSSELEERLRAHPGPPAPPVAPAPSRRTFVPPESVTQAPKIGRNEPCPCGSGKKYKKCCMP